MSTKARIVKSNSLSPIPLTLQQLQELQAIPPAKGFYLHKLRKIYLTSPSLSQDKPDKPSVFLLIRQTFRDKVRVVTSGM